MVSESFVRQYLADEEPIDKHLLVFGRKSYEIIGVVGDTRWTVVRSPEPMMYFPHYSGNQSDATLEVRSAREVTSFALPIQRIVQQLDAELAVSDVLTMGQIIGRSTLDASFDATLLLAFAAL